MRCDERCDKKRCGERIMMAWMKCVAMSCACVCTVVVHAQTLDLDGVSKGPALTAVNAANDLGRQLEDEARTLLVEAGRLTAEAQTGLQARAKLRNLAAFLLQNGAERPWDESAPVVMGMRVAGMLKRCDGLIGSTLAARRVDETPLKTGDARLAIAALERLARSTLDQVRAAAAAKPKDMPALLTDALALTLAPLVELAQIVEGTSLDDPWPILPSARLMETRRANARATVQSLRAKAAGLTTNAVVESVAKALTAVELRSAASTTAVDLGLIESAIDTLLVLQQMAAGRPPLPMPLMAIQQASDRLTQSLSDLGLGANALAQAPRMQLAALATTSRVAQLMLSMRDGDMVSDADRIAFSEASAALLGGELSGDDRARARVATRIEAACDASQRLTANTGTSASEQPLKDLKDVTRALDRDVKAAIKPLPATFARMAADPAAAADPALLSALDRVLMLDEDLSRVLRLQSLVDSLTGIRPKAGRGFAKHARLMARMLLDPLKRANGQAAFASLEAQFAQAIPFAYEEELQRRTDRALVLTGGEAAKILEIAGTARAQWADALSRGDFAGPASVRLERIARLCACLRDLDPLDPSVTREGGDRLAMWGGWASRRAVIAPAALDLTARSVLACKTMVRPESKDSAGRDAMTQFEQDVAALERAIPIVRLVSQLERSVVPMMTAPSNTVVALLAPLVSAAAPDAYLVREAPRLQVIDRALFESEFARRSGNLMIRDALAAFIATIAKDVSQSAFGAPVKVMAIPGFDGSNDADANGSTKDRMKDRTKGESK